MKRQRHWTYSEERIRKQVLIRDNYECQIRGDGCLLTANTVDHIHPKAWGGRATPDNLRAACKPCNQAKGARSAGPVSPVGGGGYGGGGGSILRTTSYRTAPLRKISLQTSQWTTKPVDYSRKRPDADQ